MSWSEGVFCSRPRTLEDVAHQKAAVSMLKAALEEQELPHMLFYGPPGTGKTTVALIVARRLFGSSFAYRVLELNASDDRGIDVVRHKIKNRASLGVEASDTLPAFRLIILDEADCMTKDAQKALLRTIEVYSHHTRFIILCNYVSRLIGPLVSRCARIRFQSLPYSAMKERICYVCGEEGVEVGEGELKALMRAAGGDLRRAIMLLQSAVSFGGAEVSLETVLEVSGYVPEAVMEYFESMSATNPSRCHTAVKDAIRNGYSAHQILQQLSTRLLYSADYNDVQKGEMFEAIAEADAKLSEGSSEVLQLLTVGSAICKASDPMVS